MGFRPLKGDTELEPSLAWHGCRQHAKVAHLQGKAVIVTRSRIRRRMPSLRTCKVGVSEVTNTR